MSKTKIPAFRVRVVNATAGAEQEVHRQDFKAPPGTDFLDFQYGALQWDRIRARKKTFDGNMLITFRDESGGAAQGEKFDAAPGRPAELSTSGGQLFRIVVDQLPKAEWATGQAMKFKAPSVTVVGEADGWRVTFSPSQLPCVLTAAIDAVGTKDENLPSFPFPSNPQFQTGSYLIPYGEFGSKVGGILRLGVRGAGLTTRLALPKKGKAVEVDPAAFEVQGPAQPEFLADPYVNKKYREKNGLIQYG